MRFASNHRWLALAILTLMGSAVGVAYRGYFHYQRVQTDIYLPWRAARAVFFEGRNPYGKQLTSDSQLSFYGRELQPAESQLDQRRFAYPVYATFLLIPVMGLPFSNAETVTLLVLIGITVSSLFCWLDALDWKTSKIALIVLIVVTLASPPVLQGLDLRQLGLFVAGMIAASAAAAKKGKLSLAGAFLAFATVKPQEVLLPVALLLFWTLNDWRSRKKLVFGFALTFVALIVAGELASPGWISEFLSALIAYRKYGGTSGAEILLGAKLGILFTTLLLLLLARRIWKTRSKPDFMPALAMVLALQLLIMPGLFALYNAVLLIPGMLILTRDLLPHSSVKQGVDPQTSSLTP
jgi:hypothetical protein